MTDLSSLIERIEKSEGSRDLDWAIHLHDGLDGKGMYGSHPHYSTSIDAAMTLVPEGASWAVTNCRGGIPENADFSASSAAISVNGGEYRANAATPALALCAAALKARNPSHEG